MSRISIPTPVLPGIKYISGLDDANITKLVNYIALLPIEIEFSTVAEELDTLLDIQTGRNLLQTIMSFNSLIENNDEENKKVAERLTNSYIDLSGDELSEKDKIVLINNLYLILSNFNSVKQIIDAREIYSSNENNLSDLSMITDLRLIFKDNIEDKDRSAIIIHKLNLEYSNSNDFKELYLTLDIKDLNKLKVLIENAIQKDQILRDDYKDVLNFIF